MYNLSQYTLSNLGEGETRANPEDYVAKFSANAREVFDSFNSDTWLDRLASANLLYLMVQKCAAIDLHPNTIYNHEMGLVFEELIRRFADASNETAGERFTPRDVVRLATTLVFAPDRDVLTGAGVIRTIYDPCCGTGLWAPMRKSLGSKRRCLTDAIAQCEDQYQHCHAAGDETGAEQADLRRSEYTKDRDALMRFNDGLGSFVRVYEYIAQLNELFGAEIADQDQVMFAVHITEKLRTNDAVMAQVQNNPREQALKGDLPEAASAAIIDATTSHTDMTTRLLSDTQTMEAFVGMLYDLLSKSDVRELLGGGTAP